MKATLAALLLVACAVAWQQSKRPQPKPKAKPAAVEQYDPDHLAPGEVACGREKPGDPSPCECMKHRTKAAESAQAECEKIGDRKDRDRCYVANEACAITPVDADHAGWDENTNEKMPAQCKRSCSKARCECCKS